MSEYSKMDSIPTLGCRFHQEACLSGMGIPQNDKRIYLTVPSRRLTFSFTIRSTSLAGICQILLSPSTTDLTSQGSAACPSSSRNGPSVSVNTRSLGIDRIKAAPFWVLTMVGPTENQHPREMARRSSVTEPEYQCRMGVPLRGLASRQFKTSLSARRL